MAAAALVRSTRCYACRRDVLRSFVRVSGLTNNQTTRMSNESQRRRFFTTPYLKVESADHHSSDRNIAAEIHDPPIPDESANSSQDVPWYLQVEPAIETTHTIARQQQIPDVPENAPPITRELLQHLSLEIGLDDMVLLDLRGRDPPPALGGNVIMVIGSARGVKHLNVSADRFCRWLRSTYKLRPYADGLLGRNELKIKLRRKARRARLASSAGTTADTSDDGITTGWICVNVGSVDDPSNIQNMREGGFEGFGKVQGGTRIVVQMFTEEKRADVDLEQLWAPKKDVKGQESEESRRLELAEEDYQVRLQSSTATEHESNQPMSNVSRPPPRVDLSQRRNFSTSARQNSFHSDVNPGSNCETADVEGEPGRQERQLSTILQTLKELSSEEIIEQLGSGPEDTDSTQLLRDCYSFVGTELDRNCSIRLMLGAAAVSVQHPGYTKEFLWTLFLEQTASGYRMSEPLAFEVASAFLVPRLEAQEQKRTISELIDFDIESAMRVMDNLSLNGETIIMKHRVYNMMYRALILSLADEKANDIPQKALRIRTLMNEIGLEWRSTDTRETMQLRLLLGDVDGFYEIWHAIAFNEGSRTADDYEVLFRVHAEAGNAVHARECLAVWISMMEREHPAIQPDAGIISAIAQCAYVAGQNADEFRLSSVSKEWHEAQPLIVEEMKALEQLS